MTPLQAAVMAAAVANKGLVWKPYIVDKIKKENGDILYENEPFLINRIRLNNSTWELIDTALKEVVNSGTGRGAKINGLEVRGKTGTAQNPHGDDHAWFVAYASMPGEEPEIALAVLVEHGEHGASAAAPIAAEVMYGYFKERLAAAVKDGRQKKEQKETINTLN